jgi:hypothetical protein
MKSILREYIRAALAINEADVTLSAAALAGLNPPAIPDTTQNADLANPALEDFIAKANTVIQNNLDSYVADAQQEINKLENIGFADIDASDLIAFAKGLAATTAADSTDIDKTMFPIRTAIYLMALDQSIPSASDAATDIGIETLSNIFRLFKIQRFGSIEENKSKNYMTFQLLSETSPASSAGSEIWRSIMAGLDNTLGAGWRATKRGANYLADPGDKVVKNYANYLTQALASEKVLGKVPEATRDALNLAVIRTVEALPVKRGDAAVAKLAGNPSRAAKDTVRAAVDKLTVPEQIELESLIVDAVQKAAVTYAKSANADPSKFLYNAATDAQIKSVVEVSLRSIRPDLAAHVEIESIATDPAVIDYFNTLITTAIREASFLSKAAIGTTKGRFTIVATAATITAWCSESLYSAINSAGRAQPDAEIPADKLVALLAFNNLVIQGRAAADSVSNTIANVLVSDMTKEQSVSLIGALTTLQDIMNRDPMQPKTATELDDVSSKLTAEFV